MANARWDASVSALQAETGMVNSEVALLAGYFAAGDGGGGIVSFTTTIPANRTITGATNASPIVVTTSAAHGFANAQRVMIAGVGGNTAANGTWLVSNVTGTTFSLDGSTGNGSYTGGGAIGDGGSTIPSGSATAGLWSRIDLNEVNVKWFGAKFDGSTDDTDAIKSAIAYSASQTRPPPVILPSGLGIWSDTLTIKSQFGLIIRGQGPYATGLQWTGPEQSPGKPGFKFDGTAECALEGLRITVGATKLATAIEIGKDTGTVTSTRHRLRDVQILAGGKIGIMVHYRLHSLINDTKNDLHVVEDCQFEEYTDTGIVIEGYNAKRIFILNTLIQGRRAGNYGIDTGRFPGYGGAFTMIGGQCQENKEYDFRLSKPNDAILIANVTSQTSTRFLKVEQELRGTQPHYFWPITFAGCFWQTQSMYLPSDNVIIDIKSPGPVNLVEGCKIGPGGTGGGTLKIRYRPQQRVGYASNRLVPTANPNAGDWVRIGEKTYYWRTTLAAAYDVLLGATIDESLDNLVLAVNRIDPSTYEGVKYGTGTQINEKARAFKFDTDSMTAEALVIGTDGNSIVTTESIAGSWFSGATMSGGVPGVAHASNTLTATGIAATETVTIGTRTYTWKTTLSGIDDVLIGASVDESLDNLVLAVNRSDPMRYEGVKYGTGTAANQWAIACRGDATSMIAEAIVDGVDGNSIVTTETMANGSWLNGTKMVGGAPGTYMAVRGNFVIENSTISSSGAVDEIFTDDLPDSVKGSFHFDGTNITPLLSGQQEPYEAGYFVANTDQDWLERGMPIPRVWHVAGTSTGSGTGLVLDKQHRYKGLDLHPYAMGKTISSLSVTVSAAGQSFERSSGNYLNDGFKVGQLVTWSGFTNASNNAVRQEITALTATLMTLGNTSWLVDENGNGKSVTLWPYENEISPWIGKSISHVGVQSSGMLLDDSGNDINTTTTSVAMGFHGLLGTPSATARLLVLGGASGSAGYGGLMVRQLAGADAGKLQVLADGVSVNGSYNYDDGNVHTVIGLIDHSTPRRILVITDAEVIDFTANNAWPSSIASIAGKGIGSSAAGDGWVGSWRMFWVWTGADVRRIQAVGRPGLWRPTDIIALLWKGAATSGDRVLNLHAFAGPVPDSGSAGAWVAGQGYMEAIQNGTLYFAIPLSEGNRIKSVAIACQGDGTADFTDIKVHKRSASMVDSVIGTSGSVTPGTGWADVSVDVTDTTLAAGDTLYIEFVAEDGVRFGNIRVTYDRP